MENFYAMHHQTCLFKSQVSGPVLDVLIERLNDLVVIFFDDDDPEDKTFLDQVKQMFSERF